MPGGKERDREGKGKKGEREREMAGSRQGFISSPVTSGLWVERLGPLCERG